MPTALQVGPYRFSFFSSDRGEPSHVHVLRDTHVAKFWLEPVALAKNRGFPQHELSRLRNLVAEQRETLLEAWDDFFGT
jgi:uncharacterized protein DUF4160